MWWAPNSLRMFSSRCPFAGRNAARHSRGRFADQSWATLVPGHDEIDSHSGVGAIGLKPFEFSPSFGD